MVFKKSKGANLPAFNAPCWVTNMAGIIEVKSMPKVPTGLRGITKIDQDHYLVNATGEVCAYKKSENRADNIASIKKTLKALRHIINANFTGASNEVFATLTYAENMTDKDKLCRDVEVFMKRLRRRYPGLEYLNVVEPQARGAWHCHILLKAPNQESLYIPNKEIAKLWGHGFTNTRRLSSVDNIGAYLTAYLADLEVPFDTPLSEHVVEKVTTDIQGKSVKKRFAKGARLHLYPSGMNLFRHSRGIRKPETVCMSWESVKKEVVGDATPNYSSTVEIFDEEKEVPVNTISYYQYNLRRAKSQVEHVSPVPSAPMETEGTNCNDDSTGNSGISHRTANQGQQPQDTALLPQFTGTVHPIQRYRLRGRFADCTTSSQILCTSCRPWHTVNHQHTDIHTRSTRLSAVALCRGVPYQQPCGQVQVTESAAQNSGCSDR